MVKQYRRQTGTSVLPFNGRNVRAKETSRYEYGIRSKKKNPGISSNSKRKDQLTDTTVND